MAVVVVIVVVIVAVVVAVVAATSSCNAFVTVSLVAFVTADFITFVAAGFIFCSSVVVVGVYFSPLLMLPLLLSTLILLFLFYK